MLRTIIWFIYFFLYLIYSIPSLIKANRLLKQGQMEAHEQHVTKITSNWAKSLLRLAGVRVHVRGGENIPSDACLIVSNHQGNFDIPILMGYLQRKISFISKKEVKKLPIINRWMEHMSCIFIDRKNRRQSIKAILDGVNKLEQGHHVMIFPEGTRSKGNKIGDFKQGSFKLATRSKTAILPVTINGSYLAMEANKNIIRPADVTLTISKPIRIHLEEDVSEQELAKIVQQEISTNLHVEEHKVSV
ncbi:lysophospholipid acyltransferase family protein [Evansella cellulosilytica]|uniref:1-acyl-sn-glycerol-3-phosphate acyltransferase n=1 Tax=Evansella cellulosilytica (strain ATCC 21833 / DSM 2522 / FERM P-1141 / JCM 9156 / N-4) TaxID=649639 RepID=E6U065_EVAC2|nr:lysophospholipid acyltransferase family protein [Evansella cellulosilytica]ADU29069.1 1-acyl-sn-glycerol-3-phosphate acyltransferase [Evansella cellulosilytica DSM 2522]